MDLKNILDCDAGGQFGRTFARAQLAHAKAYSRIPDPPIETLEDLHRYRPNGLVIIPSAKPIELTADQKLAQKELQDLHRQRQELVNQFLKEMNQNPNTAEVRLAEAMGIND